MSKYTPGPWTLEYETMVMKDDRSIATCGGWYTNTDPEQVRNENLANARIIAAAPLLYEALRALIVDDGPAGNPMVDASLDKLRAAQAALDAAGGSS